MREKIFFDGKLRECFCKKRKNGFKKLITSSSTSALLPFSVESSLAGACVRAWLFAWSCVLSEFVVLG